MLTAYLVVSVLLGSYGIWENWDVLGRAFDFSRPLNERLAALILVVLLLLFSPFVFLYALLMRKQ